MESPKLVEYCNLLYDRFLSQSTKENEYLLWKGRLTSTARDIGIPDGVYRRVVDQLIDLGCIDQLQTGMRGQPTIILLHFAPTAKVWNSFVKSGGRALTPGDTPAILSQRVRELERRLEGIDLKQGFVDMDRELKGLDGRLKKIESGNANQT